MARFGKDMVIYATADLLGSSIGLVLSPIFTRLLTPAQYGAQAALGAIWSFVALAQFGGMDSAFPNFRSRTTDEAERRRLRVTATFVAVVSAVVVSGAFGVVGLLTPWITSFAEVSPRELLGYILTLAPGAIVGWFLYILRYERRALAFAGVSLLGRVVGAIVLIPVMLATVPSERLWVGFLISAVVSALAAVLGGWILARGGLTPFAARWFDAKEAKAMFRFGIVLVPGFAIYATSTVLDRLLVTWFAGPSETAVLALALRLGAVATMLRTWFALVWDPQLIEWIPTLSRDALLARLQDAQALIALVGAVLVGMAAVWTQPVVTLLYPQDYWSTIPLVPWIVLGVAVSALSLVAVATTTMARISKLHLPVYLFGLALNLGVGWWWVPKIGAAGAVAGAMVAEAGILGCWIWIGTRYLKNLPIAWLRTWMILAAAAALVFVYRPGFLPVGGVWAERLVASGVVLLLFGLPLVRRWRAYREERGA